MNSFAKRLEDVSFYLVAGVYCLSFVLPTLGKEPGMVAFYAALIYCVHPVGFSWFANVAVWFGIYRLAVHNWGGAARAGMLAMFLAAIPYSLFGNELSVGYYVWVSSMALMTVFGLIGSYGACRPITNPNCTVPKIGRPTIR